MASERELKVSRATGRLAAILAAFLLAVPAVVHAAPPDPVRFGVAIEMGDIAAAQAWLDEGLDPNFLADRIGTGLMIGAWDGDIPMMELFLNRGADINKTNAAQEQALMHAAWRGRAEAVRWLLDHGARINRDGAQWSALHYAVFAGHEDVARLLIERGADVNARSTNGSSVLMIAAHEGREALARMLLERGADARLANDSGDDALSWAMRYRHVRIAQLVATPEQFADAAKHAGKSAEPPVRSVPVPEKIDALLREMRIAEAEGRLSDELMQDYLIALAELRKTAATPASETAAAPKALEISAKRGAPGEESAVLIYDRGAAEPLKPGVQDTKPVKRGAPKRKNATSAK